MSKRPKQKPTPPPVDKQRAHHSQSDLYQLAPGSPCCAGGPNFGSYADVAEGSVPTPVGDIPRVATTLTFKDRSGAWKVRWGIGRMKYVVAPGLYAVGNPTADSLVFVTANFKMSFDRFRSHLRGRDAWIMVLDTKGINVWCAAGKGTFGTEEIVRRVASARLKEIVSHRKLILPQLGGPGVAAHEVKDRTGFRVIYGPIRAADLAGFLDNKLKVTPEMRLVHFGWLDRVVLIPVEIVMNGKHLLLAALAFFLLSGLGTDLFSLERMLSIGWQTTLLLMAAYLAGGALTPALLPWLPGRSFALKGAVAGVIMIFLVGLVAWTRPVWPIGVWDTVAWCLMAPAVASFMGMNFTGSSTYTSLSGVRREMRMAVPVQIVGAALGLVLWITARFV